MPSINDLPSSSPIDLPRLQQRITELEEQITEQQQIIATLRDSEARWRRLTESTREGVALSYQGTILDANDQFAAMMGCGRDHLIGPFGGAEEIRRQIAGRSRCLGGCQLTSLKLLGQPVRWSKP